MNEAIKFSTAWAMPNRWTFEIAPIRSFLGRWLKGCETIIDPFCGRSVVGTLRNDLVGGTDAGDWCESLLPEWSGRADAVLFDPPYSPTQLAKSYKEARRIVTKQDTQSIRLYSRVRKPLTELLKPGGIALSFGWQSSGFGKHWKTLEILMVQHGGGHNDTICVAQRKL